MIQVFGLLREAEKHPDVPSFYEPDMAAGKKLAYQLKTLWIAALIRPSGKR